MEYEDLPKEMQEEYDNLKHSFLSIQCEVEDALDEAENLEEFQERVYNRMKELKDASMSVGTLFATLKKKLNVKERDHILFGEEVDYSKELGGSKEIKNISLTTLKTLLEKGFIASDDQGTENALDCDGLIRAMEVSPEKLTVSGHVHEDRIDLDSIEGKGLDIKEMDRLVWVIHWATDYCFDIEGGELSAYWD